MSYSSIGNWTVLTENVSKLPNGASSKLLQNVKRLSAQPPDFIILAVLANLTRPLTT